MELLASPESWIALLTLTSLEIVLGIDNVVFIAILCGRLDPSVQLKAQRLGLLGALVTRIMLLLVIKWVMGLDQGLFAILGNEFSGRDLILLAGGLFLIAKATHEVHAKFEEAGESEHLTATKAAASFMGVIIQIMLIDIVFSLDSVITAVGMAKHIPIMVAAIIIAVGVMMIFANQVSRFIKAHPTMKILALSFLLLIGVMLVAEGFGKHIERGYIYFAMGFSLMVELINVQIAKRRQRVRTQTLAPTT